MTPRIGLRSSQSIKAVSNGHRASQGREFSSSASQPFHASCRHATRLRRNMFAWLNGPGRVFQEPLPNSTNYLGAYDKTGGLLRTRNNGAEENETEAEAEQPREEDEDESGLDEAELQQRREAREAELAEAKQSQSRLPPERTGDLRPFPLNREFRSQSVLSEELREEVWRQVVEEKQTISTVSAVFGIDMRRVAAVVRLKTVEKDWVAKDRKLATPYASAVLSMLPQTKWDPKKKLVPHESINDLPVHPWTRQQIFYPTSESRQFTRADAAKVFSPTLLPADDRIPHPELIQLEREAAQQIPREQRLATIQARDLKLQKEKEKREQRQKEWEAKNLRTVAGTRWDFNFTNVSVEAVGKDGRAKGGVGWRYGNPHGDRKRGAVKIPTSVE